MHCCALQEKNFGMVKQALAALNRNNIQRLTKTYVTLSLSDLAAQAGLGSPAEAEKALLNMVGS